MLPHIAQQIWQAGVESVRGERLIADQVAWSDNELRIQDQSFSLQDIDRITVVGAGKAAGSLAAALESSLGTQRAKKYALNGWVNVPDEAIPHTEFIHLHAARPAAINEPTERAVAGTRQILQLVGQLTPRDLCLVLLTGGGSALLSLPIDGITLADKVHLTRALSAAGADIGQLNTVRKQLSLVKGGGLSAAAANTGCQMISLILSDVLGDPLDVIASGPTVGNSTTARQALQILKQFMFREGHGTSLPPGVLAYLEKKAQAADPNDASQKTSRETSIRQSNQHDDRRSEFVLGNNQTAVQAAAAEARKLGFEVVFDARSNTNTEPSATANEDGRRMALRARKLAKACGGKPACYLSGGEPVVQLAPVSQRGRGGRNQQLVLAALLELSQDPNAWLRESPPQFALLSGGTDGEDGPTDAAGAIIHTDLVRTFVAAQLDESAELALARNDAYSVFASLRALWCTGLTGTNVCDLRVLVATG